MRDGCPAVKAKASDPRAKDGHPGVKNSPKPQSPAILTHGPRAKKTQRVANDGKRRPQHRTNSLPPEAPKQSPRRPRQQREAEATRPALIGRSPANDHRPRDPPTPPRPPRTPRAAAAPPRGAAPAWEEFDDPCRPGAPQARSRLPAWEIWAKKGLPSADRNNKATLLLTGPFRTSKSSAKDLIPRVSKLQYTSARPRVSRGAGVPAL